LVLVQCWSGVRIDLWLVAEAWGQRAAAQHGDSIPWAPRGADEIDSHERAEAGRTLRLCRRVVLPHVPEVLDPTGTDQGARLYQIEVGLSHLSPGGPIRNTKNSACFYCDHHNLTPVRIQPGTAPGTPRLDWRGIL
jgi:hypothetical protein